MDYAENAIAIQWYFNRACFALQANHLFGKYLRVESFRKALVHQKRYLLIMLQTYQENEAKALALIKGRQHPAAPAKPKRPSFRYVHAIPSLSFECPSHSGALSGRPFWW